jgi:rhodanese-related sulfurtransferase
MVLKRILPLGVIAVLALVACSSGSGGQPAAQEQAAGPELAKNAAGFTDITVAQLANMMENKDFVLVNVHVPFEGDLPQTDLSIPFNEIGSHLGQLPDRDARIVLYCRSGNMSTQAAQELAGLGYSNVMELDGGFNAWKAAGHAMAGQ